MPHFPKPFFKNGRGCWYVEIDRKQHNLGPDKDQAFERYHELMRHKPREQADCSLAVGVLDAFLAWAEKNTAPRSFEWYQRHLQSFARRIPPLLSVGQLKKHHLTSCLARLAHLSSTTQNGLCRAVARAFQWAEDEELILRSPFRRVKKPRAKRREVIISPAEFTDMLASFPSEEIQDLLSIAWETPARPQEIVRVEARHVDLANSRWVFPVEESKGHKFQRVVYLTEKSLFIVRKLMFKHPTGPLLRTTEGEPWTRQSISCVFSRLQVTLGLRKLKELGLGVATPPRFKRSAFQDKKVLKAARAEHEKTLYERRKELHKLARKHGRKYCLYHFRHSWATRALQRGLDPLTVAILMGHNDPSMLAKVYQHLAHDPEFLRNATKRATG